MVIGVLGASSGVGATHFALSLANALSKTSTLFHRKKIAIIEMSNDRSIKNLGIALEQILEDDEGDYFSYKGVDYFPCFEKKLSTLQRSKYDYMILDCGSSPCEAYMNADKAFIVCSSRPWKKESPLGYENYNLVDEQRGLETVTFVMPFATKESKKEIEKFASKSKFYYLPFESDPISDSKIVLDEVLDKENTQKDASKNLSPEDEAYKRTLELEAQARILKDDLKKKETELLRQKRQAQMNAFKATHDALTGLGNRAGFDEAINLVRDYVLIAFDVNNLKTTNDNLGHQKGDILITTIAKEISQRFPNSYRTGGDEFTAIVTASDFNTYSLLNLDAELARLSRENGEITFQVAHGYAKSSEANSVAGVIALADSRMYEDKKAKKSGKTSMESTSSPWDAFDQHMETNLTMFESIADDEDEMPEPDEDDYVGEETEDEESSIDEVSFEEQTTEDEPVGIPPIITDVEPEQSNVAVSVPVIAGTEIKADIPLKKEYDEQWYCKETLFLETQGKTKKEAVMLNLFIYPTVYTQPNQIVPAVVMTKQGQRKFVSYGRPCRVIWDSQIGGAYVDVACRIDSQGDVSATLMFPDNVTPLERTSEPHKGKHTPDSFGIPITGAEVYPVMKNSNGTCDAVILRDGEALFSSGTETDDNGTFDIICGDEAYEIIYRDDTK